MKNNKGFTITTTLFGTFILFLLLLASVLSILSLRMNNMKLLMGDSDEEAGRNVATMKAVWYQNFEELRAEAFRLGDGATGGLFCFREHAESETECRYVSRASLVGVSKNIYADAEFTIKDGIVGYPFEADYGGYYEVNACGASGGSVQKIGSTSAGSGIVKGGKGTCIKSYIKLAAGDTLFVNIGGKGNQVTSKIGKDEVVVGGYNGGGAGKARQRSASEVAFSQASGGGSTDIRIGGEYYDTGDEEIPSKMDGTTKIYEGPNYRATSGSYQVDIYGQSLNLCDYTIHNNGQDEKNNIKALFSNGKNYTNDHYVMWLHVKEDSLDGGIEIYASQKNYEASAGKCIIKREVFSKIENRILVAAGGGGSSYYNDNKFTVGGDGGVITGLNGTKVLNSVNSFQTNSRGIQINGGGINPFSSSKVNFVNGGSTSRAAGSGGGGGYWGGAASDDFPDASGGGSSFVSGVAGMNALTKLNDKTSSYFGNPTSSNQPLHYSGKYFFGTTFSPGVHEGNGSASIKYLGTEEPKRNGLLNNVRYVRDCINDYVTPAGVTDGKIKRWLDIQVIKDGQNIIAGKEPYTSLALGSGSKLSYATDGSIPVEGKIDTVNTYSTALNYFVDVENVQCLSFDLGNIYNVDEIAVWHTGPRSGYYKYNTIQVSNDGKNWTIFDFGNNSNNREDTDGKRITAWEEFDESKISHSNYVWIEYNYNTNKTFYVKEYVDTGYKLDFSKSFKIQTRVKFPKADKNYLIVSNINSKDALPTFGIGIEYNNSIAVYINGTAVARSEKNTIFADEFIDIEFSWDALTNRLWLNAYGTKTHVMISNKKPLHPYHYVDWSKDFEINTTINVADAGTNTIAGMNNGEITLSDMVTINTRSGKFLVYLRKNNTTKSYEFSSFTYNEDIDVKFKWNASRQEFDFIAKGEETDISDTKKFEVADGTNYYLRYGMADYRNNPQDTFKNPITVQYFRILTKYLVDTPYYDTPKASSGREVVENFKTQSGNLLQNGMNIPKTDERYFANWTTNYTNVVYDYNIDKEFGYDEQYNTGYIINWDRDFIIDMDFSISDSSKLYYLLDLGSFKILTESSNRKLYVSLGEKYSGENIPNGEILHLKFIWSSFYKKYILTLTGNGVDSRLEYVRNKTGLETVSVKLAKVSVKNETMNVKSFKITDVYLKGEEFTKFPIAVVGSNVLAWRDSSDNVFVNGIATRANNTTYNVTLIENKFTYHMDTNGGQLPSSSSSSVEYTYGSTYGRLPTPTLAGKTFAGWYLDDDTTKLASDTKIPYAFDHTIYAKWK